MFICGPTMDVAHLTASIKTIISTEPLLPTRLIDAKSYDLLKEAPTSTGAY